MLIATYTNITKSICNKDILEKLYQYYRRALREMFAGMAYSM